MVKLCIPRLFQEPAERRPIRDGALGFGKKALRYFEAKKMIRFPLCNISADKNSWKHGLTAVMASFP